MEEKQVERIVFNLTKVKNALLKAKMKTPKSLIDWLQDTVIPFCKKTIEELKAEKPEYKKTMTNLLNSSISLHEGLSSGNADLADAVELSRDFHIAAAQFEYLFDADEKKAKRDANKPSGDGLFRMTQESGPTILKYSIFAQELPQNLYRQLFVVKRMPVIPVADPPLNFAKLKQYKLADDHISFYPVIKNQPVLGINPNWVQDSFKGKSDSAVEYVLDSIKLKFGRTHQLMPGSVHTGSVVWFWIPTEPILNRILACAPSGKMSIKKWGFAFNV